MKTVHVNTARTLSRRHFLRGAGVLLGLPLLDAMAPAFARADTKSLVPRRFLGICNNLGVLPDKFFPTADQTGRDYTLSPYLETLRAFAPILRSSAVSGIPTWTAGIRQTSAS